jgi:hypothetical protein
VNSKAKGELSEAIILAHLLKKGFSVSIPFGNNQRYDMIVDDGVTLSKVQCKTAHTNNGCAVFNTSSVNGFTSKKTHYVGQIDYFLVYHPETGSIFKVPVNDVGRSSVLIRFVPARGGGKTVVRHAKDYLI